MDNKPKVCVAMSGGVDSAVAAALLVKDGYEVSAAFMKNWSVDQEGVDYHPWQNEAETAAKVCEKLKIPFSVFDFEKEYRERVVNAFVKEYSLGHTPNPDVLCNREIKFDLFIKEANKQFGAEKIATGHYAQIEHKNGQYHLYRGVDPDKDQSYFLYTLGQDELAKVIFPVGAMLKSEVRQLARDLGLPNAEKKDSQGICFIGPVSMRQFLQHYIPIKSGEVITPAGRVLGKHDGVIYYTEGQRHGFNTEGNREPLYVAQKLVKTNQLVVVPQNHPLLFSNEVTLSNVTWTINQPSLPAKMQVRTRYRQVLSSCVVKEQDGKISLQFDEPIKAVSIGQSAVLYNNDEVVGGGVIFERQ